MEQNKPILTITGSDSAGGSGVQADIKTISALGGYAVSAITSITVQNTLGIQEFYDLPSALVAKQIDAVVNDVEPQVVKIGMLRNVETLSVVVEAIRKYRPSHVVYVPVVRSSHGEDLMSEDVVEAVARQLLPLCTLVLVSQGDVDFAKRVQSVCPVYQLDEGAMHGLANSFSSAVAFNLNKGEPVDDALSHAKAYINTLTLRTKDMNGRIPELYNEFLDQVAASCQTNSDVAFYADRLNVSSRYLAQVTKRISGKSPKTIIDDIIVGKVEMLLSTTDKTIQEIAYEYGFSSQAHFAKFFKKMRGKSPSQFRKE